MIIYEKDFGDGVIYYLEEKRNKRKSLSFQTMYKKKKRVDSSDGSMLEAPALTSQSASDNLNSLSTREVTQQSANPQTKAQESDNDGELQEAVEGKPSKPKLSSAGRPLRSLSPSVRKAVEDIARALGVKKVVWDETLDENGRYNPETGELHIALDADNPLDVVFGHEVTHHVHDISEEAYTILRDALADYFGPEEWARRLESVRVLYNVKHNLALTEKGIEEEAVCDGVGEILHDQKMAEHLAESLSQTEHGRSVLSAIKDILRKIREWFKSRGMKKEENGIARVIQAIEKAFAKAAKVADKKNTMPGDVITNKQGEEVAEVDGQGNLRPKYSERTYRNWTDNLGVEHQGTRERIQEYLQNKKMPKAQIDKFLETMDYWADLNHKIANFVDADGNFKFKAFHDWSQQTPLYRKNEEGVVRAVSTLVSNGEYPLNFELSTDCIKREAFTQILNEMLKFDGRFFKKLTPARIVDIQNLEKSYGIQVACSLCFVEGKRLGIMNWATKVVNKWNEALKEVTGGKVATEFGFGTGTYVPENPLSKETTEKQAAIIRQLNEVSNLLSGMDGVLPEDLEIMRRNQRATDRLIQQFKDEYAAKHDGSVEGFVMTKTQEGELTKQMNQDMRSAKARMVKAMAKFPELRHRLDIKDLLGSKGLMAIRSQNGEAFEQMYSLISVH